MKNSIDVDHFLFNEKKRNEFRKKLGIKDDMFVVGFIGRMAYQKNPEKVVKIFKELLNRNCKSQLIMIGDGDLMKKIKKLIVKSGIEKNVNLVGNVDDVSEYLQAFDLMILPSRYEGLGIVLIEAQAAGLKCIVSNNVPNEADITGNVVFVPSSDGLGVWCNEIVNNLIYERANQKKAIVKNGYDNDSAVRKVELFYEKLNAGGDNG